MNQYILRGTWPSPQWLALQHEVSACAPLKPTGDTWSLRRVVSYVHCHPALNQCHQVGCTTRQVIRQRSESMKKPTQRRSGDQREEETDDAKKGRKRSVCSG